MPTLALRHGAAACQRGRHDDDAFKVAAQQSGQSVASCRRRRDTMRRHWPISRSRQHRDAGLLDIEYVAQTYITYMARR